MRYLYSAFLLVFSLFGAPANASGLPLLFWEASDIEAPFGNIRCGAEMLENEGRAEGYPEMQVELGYESLCHT